jgi:hypothetical protein
VNPNKDVSDAEKLSAAQLGIVQLTSTEWLVRDAQILDGDPAALLGVIQQSGDAYEVTKLGVLGTRWFYTSFDQARESFLKPRCQSTRTFASKGVAAGSRVSD